MNLKTDFETVKCGEQVDEVFARILMMVTQFDNRYKMLDQHLIIKGSVIVKNEFSDSKLEILTLKYSL